MGYSTCCGAETDMEEVGICPECLEHCNFEEDDEETSQEELEQDRQNEIVLEQEQINKNENNGK
jgi:hypothetical protein